MPQNGTPGPDILIGTWYLDLISGAGGHDLLAGDRGDDTLQGDAGNDILWGGLGGDILNGGAGFDYAVYQSSTAGVTVNLASGIGTGGEAEGDTLANVEGLVGSDFADWLTGNTLNNSFRGGAGADHISGGAGHDRASYAYSSVAVDVDLTRSGAQSGGDAAGDVLVSIERLTGSSHDDRLLGDDKDNEFSGGAGADFIDGRAGNDFVDYRGSSAVDIDLTRAVQSGGHAEGDQLIGIESIRGSTGNDRLVGDAGRNHLIGDAGDDYIDIGVAGATRISDRVDGGSGDDTVVVHMNNNTFANLFGGSGTDTLVLRYTELVRENYMPETPTTAYFGYTFAAGFEHIEAYGTEGQDFLRGMSGTTDKLMGAGGNDTIHGGLGDYLDGGSGYNAARVSYGEDYAEDVSANLSTGVATGLAAILNFQEVVFSTGAGNDTIIGAAHRNSIYTGAGDDHVTSMGQFNYLTLGSGTEDYDTAIGNQYLDVIAIGDRGHADGGGGLYDSLDVTFTSDMAIVFEVDANGNGGSNTGLDVFNIERFWLDTGRHDDIIRTAGWDDHIQTGDGNDLIETFGDNDEIRAGGGNDEIDAGTGDDFILGGTGADRFHFSAGDDRINDFNIADGDVIVISQAWQNATQDTYAELIANAEDTSGGLLLHGSDGTSSLLLAGVTKASFSANGVEFLV
jgi:Ca2+-binding RTX toxin-like protein